MYEKLSSASKLELEIWNKNLPFKSLELKYNEDNIQMYVADNNLTNEMGEQLNTKRLNPTLASLFNENGVLVINDTILKIKDEFLYTITNGDFSLLEKIDNNINFKSEYIFKELHTIKLEPTKDLNSDGQQKAISDRTYVFYTASDERESVNFDADISGGYLTIKMHGRYQKKSGILGWIFSSSSSMVYGKINATGIHGSNNVNTNNTYSYDIEYVELKFFVGESQVPFNLNVTYTYKKTNNTAYIHKWKGTSTTTAGTFTRNYYWQQF